MSSPVQPPLWNSAQVPAGAREGRWHGFSGWLTWALLVLLCGFFFGQAPPDVNESHYLTKAKHFWNPQWCSGDLFLRSAEAHWLFFFATGWLTKFVSLETYAWLGRLLSWLLVATAWLQLSRQVSQRAWFALFSFALFLLFNLRFHLAGEWVVGGFEGKPLAYACGIWAVAAWLRGNWPQTVFLIGAAIGWHALVGGWLGLAVALATLSLGSQGIREAIAGCWPSRGSLLSGIQIAAGACLALTGVLPSLLSQSAASPEQLREVAWIQVTQRLSHHLWFTAFPTGRVAAFALLAAFCCLMAMRVLWPRALGLMFRLAFAGLLFNLIGLCLSAMVSEQSAGANVACSLLRLYWFRFADFAIPLAVALGTGWLLESWSRQGNPRLQIVIARGVLVVLSLAAGLQALENWETSRPGADAAALEQFPSEPNKELKLAANWRQVCQWIAAETPPQAVFITPARQQSFKWYAERAEVVCWKDMPQDPAGIVEWSRRLNLVYRPQLDYELGLFAFDDLQLQQLGAELGADYLLLPQAEYDQVRDRCRLPLIYPSDPQARVSFVVLRLPSTGGKSPD
ncbi:MAG: DUF6798 domain-containing protein [Planctomycetota bacterium]|jgi:hypothetical protein